MHMWDADPARRFVILDGVRMGEGDRSGSLAVVAIDRKGVVIERDGIRARIPLP
ncbi:MAG: general secretion pathway protein GspB [Thermomonas sp.]